MADINENTFFEIVGVTPHIDDEVLKIGQTLVRIRWDESERYFVTMITHRRIDGELKFTIPTVLSKYYLPRGYTPEGWV